LNEASYPQMTTSKIHEAGRAGRKKSIRETEISSKMTPRSSKAEIIRKPILVVLSHLPRAIRRSCWDLSESFWLGEVDDDDEEERGGEFPIQSVRFDKKDRRYHSTSKLFKDDDVILQAMVMMALWRFENTYGVQTMLQQLSLYNNSGSENQESNSASSTTTDLPNLWEEEIQNLISNKKLGKTTLHHKDNYDSFQKLYATSEPPSTWARRSKTFKSNVHVLAEQASIQFVTERLVDDRDLVELSATVIRFCHQFEPSSPDMAYLCIKVLWKAALMADSGNGGTFATIAMRLISTSSE